MKHAGTEAPPVRTITRGPRPRPQSIADAASHQPHDIVVDPLRAFVFPNRVREQRQCHGYPKLMALAAALPAIPYIRLSKIERGEVAPRTDELARIARLLEIAPAALLLDVDAPSFDLAAWAEPFTEGTSVDVEEERFAVMLGAALRLRRQHDRALTITVLDKQFGLPAVILSRLENAQKPLGRWNASTRAALCRLLDAKDEAALRCAVLEQYSAGDLDPHLAGIAAPDARLARTRERIVALAAELATLPTTPPSPAVEQTPAPAAYAPVPVPVPVPAAGAGRLLPVLGSPLAAGLIAATPTPATIEAPAGAGERAFGLRVCRATLGGGMPSHATVIVDPDRFPAAGGLAVVREGDAYRLLAVTQDRTGATMGYSVAPDLEISIDALDPADIAAVIAASFI